MKTTTVKVDLATFRMDFGGDWTWTVPGGGTAFVRVRSVGRKQVQVFYPDSAGDFDVVLTHNVEFTDKPVTREAVLALLESVPGIETIGGVA